MPHPQRFHQCRSLCACSSFTVAAMAIGLLSFTPARVLAAGPNRTGLYVPPNNAFVINPGETPITLTFGSASLADIQTQLDAARTANPDTPIILTLRSTYTVTDTPLTLPSRTSVVLYGTIRASRNATAASLIAISGQSKVAIAGGHLDGRGADLAGIAIDTSSKINIDDVTITNTGRDGITLSGNGNDTWDQGSAITRCDISRAGANGITIAAITQALVFDNYVHLNAAAGIASSAVHGSIANNASRGNDIGILVSGTDNVVADNELTLNRQAGLQLTSTSANTTVLRNEATHNIQAGVDLDGANNLVYGNDLSNTSPFTNGVDLLEHATSATNWVVPRGAPLTAPVNQYFYPPTIDNQHTDPVIINGRNRTDITVAGASLAVVQQTYNDARTAHPDDVIVMHMTGDFQQDGPPLTLGSNTAVLLDGTIHVMSTATGSNSITATNPASYLSLSGGTIDCGGRVMEGIFFPSTTMLNIDGVTVTHCGEQNPRSTSNTIHVTRGGGYNIMRGNRVDISGGRCIWTQNANARFVMLENHTSHCNQDGIDFDSSTSNSVAIDNVSEDNLRYGIFIEQSDSLNTVYHNFTTTSNVGGGHGVGVYNNATSGSTRSVTDKNTVFANISNIIANGLRLGSIATATGGVAETAHTFMFNNQVLNSTGDGILFDTQFPRSIQNYFSQTVLAGNTRDLTLRFVAPATPPDFFNPSSAINLALKRVVTASSSATGSDPSGAVDGLAFTSWNAGLELRPSLTIDLGDAMTFQRVTLKQPTLPTFLAAVVQTSTDGVTFRTVAATLTLDPLVNVTFAPVTARYVRVQIEGALLRHAIVEEIAVQPQ